MIRDTEDVVARVTRFAETLSVNRHYMTGQSCMEVQDDLRALIADRQSLSDRIDVLTQALERIREASPGGEVWAIARAALHQEGIAPK